ncbi:hypothetical protein IWX78_003199 [Mycetocola sp. CAN_C7]
MGNANRGLTGMEQPVETAEVLASSTRRAARLAPTSPQPGVPIPDMVDRLPRRAAAWPATVWWLGVHGGAGESTLAGLASGSRPADHAWPIPTANATAHHVVLVARTNYSGLIAAQRAATEWAANTLPHSISLAGLVLIADTPGRRPKPLRDLEQVIAGGVPQVWHLPWVNAWRFAPASPLDPLPNEFRQLFADLSLTTTSSTHAQN